MIPTSIKMRWTKPNSSTMLTRWIVDEDVTVNGYKVIAGFITDTGSIPWGMRDQFNPVGRGLPAFIVHDAKCIDTNYSRKKADKELYRDLQDCGVNKRRAWIMYMGVRAYANATGKWS